MKKMMVAIALLMMFTGSYGETSSKLKSTKTVAAVQSTKGAESPPLPTPTGPVGIGALKIGMSKQAVEALQESDGTYLDAPLDAYVGTGSTHTREGYDEFKGSLHTPIDSAAHKVKLTFSQNKLTDISMDLDPSLLGLVVSQISDKYGPGKVKDTREEKQCLYRNGANFKLTNGALDTVWTEQQTSTTAIRTTIEEYTIDWCPASLNAPYLGPQTNMWISISTVETEARSQTNAF